VVGCSKISPGCEHCYAERMACRLAAMGQQQYAAVTSDGHWNGRTTLVEHMLDQPLRWRKTRTIFVNSMGDTFHPSVPDEWIDKLFGVMHACEYTGNTHGDAWPWHTFQVLTKRPERMRDYLSQDRREKWADWAVHFGGGSNPDMLHDQIRFRKKPHSRIWLGTTCEDQDRANERISHLLATPAAVRFVSLEPMLGPIEFDWCQECGSHGLGRHGSGEPDTDGCERECGPSCLMPPLDWVICGGESGPGARPMHPEWARSVRDQCIAAGVPYFFKQWGAWQDGSSRSGKNEIALLDGRHGETPEALGFAPVDAIGWGALRPTMMSRVGKHRAGRELDGRTWDEMPEIRHAS